MALAIKLATYANLGDEPIELSIGNAPGEAPTVYRCPPGGTVEGPASYVEAFRRAGLVVAPPPKEERSPAPAAPPPAAGVPIGEAEGPKARGRPKG